MEDLPITRDRRGAIGDGRVAARRVDRTRQLRVTLTLDVAAVILIKILEAIVHKNGRRHVPIHSPLERTDICRRQPRHPHGAAGIRVPLAVVLPRVLNDFARRVYDSRANRDKGDGEGEEHDIQRARRDNGLPRLSHKDTRTETER